MNNNFKKQIIISISIIVFVLLVSFALFKYLSDAIIKKAEEIQSLRNSIAIFTKSLSNLAKLKEVAPQVDLYQNKLKLLLPSKDELIDLPQWINDAAKANQVNATLNFKPGGKNPENNSPGFELFLIEINGSLSNIEKFLYTIEVVSPKFILNIDSFNVSESNENNYQFSGSGRAFFINKN
ncbi:MAG: type 4a pilus biogenesis protein PilO [Minisyncoccia bacterium]